MPVVSLREYNNPRFEATTFTSAIFLSMNFNEFNLSATILKAVAETGYSHPTPVQEQAIPHVLVKRDLLACAQTGTGKTAAFALPIIQLLDNTKNNAMIPIRCLILTPTRELAIQIGENFSQYGKYTQIKHTVIFGGVGQESQTRALKSGIDVLIATPGRLLDLINQKFIKLDKLEIFVLDEADRMLDMGFLHDVKKVLNYIPQKRQSLFFSATMAPEIIKLANTILNNAVKIEVTPVATTAEKVEQTVYFIDKDNKKLLLVDLMNTYGMERALVFTRTKHGANKLTQFLEKQGIGAQAIHGNKSQTARQKALEDFKASKIQVLVATDIAARGIDIDELPFVINYELPNIPESYVHRIGRTGRAGFSGKAIAFCDAEEKAYLKTIQKLIGMEIPVVSKHDYPMLIDASTIQAESKANGDRRSNFRNNNQRSGKGQQQRKPQAKQ
jgi:ATP-dependent RNA helicase RhlE